MQQYVLGFRKISRDYGSDSLEQHVVNENTTDVFEEMAKYEVKSAFEMQFHKANMPLKWEDETNKRGGRFVIHFCQNTLAFRTFCVFVHDFLSKTFPFSDKVVGAIITCRRLKKNWRLQIWITDGLNSSQLEQKWRDLNNWLLNFNHIGAESFAIDFMLHSNYLIQTGETVRIPNFSGCVKRAMGMEVNEAPPKLEFNLEVARIHKRKWSERRK